MDKVTKQWIKSKADERAVSEGYYFDLKAADHVRQFFYKFLRHSKGDFAGKPFELLPWQWEDVIGPLFGWKRSGGLRSYSNGSLWVGKKNGKSTLASGIALYMLLADGEPGGEVYACACDRDQASIVWQESANMVEVSPLLRKRLELVKSTKRIVYPETKSYYRALSADVHGKHGYNASCVIFDEVAAQRTRTLWDVLRYSTAFRRQPLFLSISTAGYNKESIGYEQFRYSEKVLDGTIYDPSFFACIYAASDSDNWKKETTWKKSNPSLGHTIPLAEFRSACREAEHEPRKESNFKTLRLNMWVGAAEQWLGTKTWEDCYEDYDDDTLKGKKCYLGLDLARKGDLASYCLVFPVEDSFYLLPRFFIPSEAAQKKEKTDKVPYPQWARDGVITLTSGDVIDYGYIRKQINEDAEKFNIVEIGYDPWNAELLCNQQLGDLDGFRVVEVKQTMVQMGPATGRFEKLVLENKVHHNGNEPLTWCVSNCVVREDHNRNIMVDKRRSTARIDGAVAAIIGLSRAQAGTVESVYNRRGIISLTISLFLHGLYSFSSWASLLT